MKNFELTFVTDPVKESLEDVLETECDAFLATHSGVTFVTVEGTGETATDAALASASELEDLGVHVRRLYLDVVNQAEIAARTGKTRTAVSNWVNKRRSAGNAFPKPYAFSSGAIWAWSDVNEWLRRTTGEEHDGATYPTPSEVDRANVALEDRHRMPAGLRVSEVQALFTDSSRASHHVVVQSVTGQAWLKSASFAALLGSTTETNQDWPSR